MNLILDCILFFGFVFIKASSNDCTERNANSCDECISIPDCAWCFDPSYGTNPNVLTYRCNTVSGLRSDGCPAAFISNPQSKKNVTMNKKFTKTSTKTTVGSATQLRPQKMDVKLRPGDPVKVKFAFKLVEDYPVDLYYMLDLSSSMFDDLNSLRSLGKLLGSSMQNITKDFKIGFGSFVDKTLIPYIFTTPEKLQNPCTSRTCAPTYSFHNDLPLTRNVDDFVKSVNKVDISSNIDNLEGGLDAMMQAVVCKDQIKWRDNATHLLLFSTDAGFHMAGDGRLAGVVVPNDGHCYLNNDGSYTKATEMDYPSIGHLVQEINKNRIQPIFAVTEEVVTPYQSLRAEIPKSALGILTKNSSNIIGLIEQAYNDLKGKVIIEVKGPKEVQISNRVANCADGIYDVLECDGVNIGDTVSFEFMMSMDSCLTEPAVVQVSVFGYNDVFSVTVYPQCTCHCEVPETHNNCSGHGEYQCGACVCQPGFTGLDCSCVQDSSAEDLEDFIRNCTDPMTNEVCNKLGDCQCGTCICRQRPGAKIDGEFCQCDNTTCPREQGKICNDAGICDCGACDCNVGWSGDKCECNLDSTPCIDTSDDAIDSEKPCNGNGVCQCGTCVCGAAPGGGTYRGSYCQTQPSAICSKHEACIECLSFGTGLYSDPNVCNENCMIYNVTKLSSGAKSEKSQNCRFTDEEDCSYEASFDEIDGLVVVDVDPERVCKEYVNPLYIIIGIIAAIVLIGLAILLLWKLLTTIKDAREYKNFQKESQNAKWQADENPIYKKATSTFKNPMYTGGKPSAGGL